MSDDTDQSAVIPFRRTSGGIEICLVQRSMGGWGTPKGHLDGDETPEQAALKEAKEEAGLEGRLVGPAIGSYRYQRWGTAYRVSVFLMEVTTELDRWDEDWLRERCWVSPTQARKALRDHPIHGLLETALSMLAGASS